MKHKKILENGTPQEQYELAERIEDKAIARQIYSVAANNGHAKAQYRMYTYLDEDKHKDAIIYLIMAVKNGNDNAYYAFFRNYLQKRKAYLNEPEIFNKILKEYEKSTDEDIRVTVGLYYETTQHNYKKAIKFYKGTLFANQIERLKTVLYEQEHPSKALREEILKKYPKIYKIINNKIVHYKNKSYA